MESTTNSFDPLTARGIKLQGEYFADCNLLVDIIKKDAEAYKELECERNELTTQIQTVIDAFLCGDADDVEHAVGRLVDNHRQRAKEVGDE